MLKTLFRMVDGERRVIHGHLSKYEIWELKRDGWREDKPQINKNGIPVGRAV